VGVLKWHITNGLSLLISTITLKTAYCRYKLKIGIMSYDENRISDQIDAGLEMQNDFHNWIDKNGWWFIHPLKVYCHKNKEIYKTYDELKEIYFNNLNPKHNE